MSEDERRAPEAEEDKAVLVRDGDGHARLVPGGDIVEGERDQSAPAAIPPSP